MFDAHGKTQRGKSLLQLCLWEYRPIVIKTARLVDLAATVYNLRLVFKLTKILKWDKIDGLDGRAETLAASFFTLGTS